MGDDRSMQATPVLARDGTREQVAREGRRLLGDARTIGQGIRMIQDLSRAGRHREAVDLAHVLYEQRGKSRDLNVLMSVILAAGATESILDVARLAERHQSDPGCDYDVQFLATWLRALYEVDDQAKFWHVFESVCAPGDKTGNLYIVGQYFRMLIRVGRYRSVLEHWETLDLQTKADGFLVKHKARALIELGRLAEAEAALADTRDDHLKRSLIGRLEDIKRRFGIRDGAGAQPGEAGLARETGAAAVHAPAVLALHGGASRCAGELDRLLARIGAELRTIDMPGSDRECSVIEQLERYAASSDAIVTLLTSDDEAGPHDGLHELEPHAREDVLIEAGFAMLSRRSRSLLVTLGGVHVPSSFAGLYRIQASDWDEEVALRVAQRLRAMGLAVDPSRAV